MKTYVAKKEDIKRKWYLVDAEGCILGRLATFIADTLRGKHKSIYTPNIDCGDYVVVINASKIIVTGKKPQQKFRWRHSGYPGGLKLIRYDKLMAETPEKLLKLVVKGMLPNNKLRDKIIKKLKVYKGNTYEEKAQKPETLSLPKRVKNI